MDRLDRELGVIQRLGFAKLLFDFYGTLCATRVNITFQRPREVAGSVQLSVMHSTSATCAQSNTTCSFERFLDENRREAPDIDIDFCKDRRGDIIQYVKDKYGDANVAQIGTFGTLQARAAIKDVGRSAGHPARARQSDH